MGTCARSGPRSAWHGRRQGGHGRAGHGGGKKGGAGKGVDLTVMRAGSLLLRYSSTIILPPRA
eukprot:593765-Rhodomonas_salina.2